MTYSTTPDGKIINNANGQEVKVDITSPQYQQYQYWQTHGVNLTAPIAQTIVAQATEVKEVAASKPEETLLEKVEDEVKEVVAEVKKLVKGQ